MSALDGTIELGRGPVSLVIDPQRGGEIVQIRYHGDAVLAQMPWPRAAPAPVDTDEDAWTRSWAGGWQLLFPNAGNRSHFEGHVYGFHGAASHTQWQVLEATADDARVAWSDTTGFRVERAVRLDDGAILVTTEVANEATMEQAFIAAEHLILGGDLVGEGCRLELPAGRLTDLYGAGTERSSQPDPLASGSAVGPNASLAAAATAGVAGEPAGARTVFSRPGTARFGCVSELAEGRAICRGERITAEVAWDAAVLPYLWVWEELRGSAQPPWGGDSVAVGLEPSTVPNDAGLGAAAAAGLANRLEPRERCSWWVVLRLRASSAISP